MVSLLASRRELLAASVAFWARPACAQSMPPIRVADFARGDGRGDQTVAILEAVRTADLADRELDWGSGLTFRIETPITYAFRKAARWRGESSRLIFDGAPSAHAVRLDTGTLAASFDGLTIDCAGRAAIGLLIRNLAMSMAQDGLGELYLGPGLKLVRATASDASVQLQACGLKAEGGYRHVHIDRSRVVDCRRERQVPQTVSVEGIHLAQFNGRSWTKAWTIAAAVDGVRCNDKSQSANCNGVFVQDKYPGSQERLEGGGSISGEIRNAWGRAVKIQRQGAVVENLNIAMTDIWDRGKTTPLIDFQYGGGDCRRVRADLRGVGCESVVNVTYRDMPSGPMTIEDVEMSHVGENIPDCIVFSSALAGAQAQLTRATRIVSRAARLPQMAVVYTEGEHVPRPKFALEDTVADQIDIALIKVAGDGPTDIVANRNRCPNPVPLLDRRGAANLTAAGNRGYRTGR
jgi:hypothetical protein